MSAHLTEATPQQLATRTESQRPIVSETPSIAAKPVANRASIPGLCSNCDHDAYCNFARAETGVWHCEEYA